MSLTEGRKARVGGLLLLGLVGLACVGIRAREGMGIAPDSTVYLMAARSVATGTGIREISWSGASVPMTHYAPLFPILLGGLAKVGLDPLTGAKWLNGCLFAGTIVMVGVFVAMWTEWARWPAWVAGTLILVSADLLWLHTSILSEPLFIWFAVLAAGLVTTYVGGASARGSSGWMVWASALAVAGAMLTRYAGGALLVAGMTSLLWPGRDRLTRRVTDALVFGTVATVPLLMWIARNKRMMGTATNRELAFHPVASGHVYTGIGTVSRWLLPQAIPPPLRAMAVIVVGATIATFIVIIRRRGLRASEGAAGMRERVLAWFVVAYVALIVTSITFVDAATTLENRILSIPYVFLIMMSVCWSWRVGQSVNLGRGLRLAPMVALAILAGLFAVRSGALLVWASDDLKGYNSLAWRESQTVGRVQRDFRASIVYSNAPDAIYALLGVAVRGVPKRFNSNSLRPNETFAAELTRMGVEGTKDGALLVFFKRVARPDVPSESELRGALDLEVLETLDDGTIYRIAAKKPDNRESDDVVGTSGTGSRSPRG